MIGPRGAREPGGSTFGGGVRVLVGARIKLRSSGPTERSAEEGRVGPQGQ